MKNYGFYDEASYDVSSYLERFDDVRYRSVEGTYDILLDDVLKFVEGGYNNLKQYSASTIVLFYDDCVLCVNASKPFSQTKTDNIRNYNIQFWGLDVTPFDDFIDSMKDFKRPNFILVSWVYMSKGDLKDVQLPLKKYGPVHQEFYPFIPKLDDYFSKFVNSSSMIMIMNGPMGTGKTSLIADFITKYRRKALTTYDGEAMKNDGFYADFLGNDEHDLLILEDADLLLLSRLASDNATISKLLNVSDGIVDTSNKKIIITANLENKKQIDSAVTRPGRCYGIVDFRKLEGQEVDDACRVLDVPLPGAGNSYSLAEIFNGAHKKLGIDMGFVAA